jgi:DNA polymerase III epsilon subunit-like protein
MVEANALVVDVETLGLDATAGICDLAVVAMDGTVILNTLINPERPIPVEATAVHSLTDADVASAATFCDVYPDLKSVLTGRIALAWNAKYDATMIQGCCERAGIVDLVTELASWQDPMQHYGAFDGEVGRYGGFRWHKLEAACRHFGIEPGGHRALADALATVAVILAMSEAAD